MDEQTKELAEQLHKEMLGYWTNKQVAESFVDWYNSHEHHTDWDKVRFTYAKKFLFAEYNKE